jgi:hypothetical protein
MTRHAVNSSNLKNVGWENGTLEVEFHSGDIYQFSNVSAAKHAALMAENNKPKGSVGAHFARNIRGVHGFVKVPKSK